MPAHDLDEVKRLAQAGRVWIHERKASEIVGDLLDLGQGQAQSFVLERVLQLCPDDFAETLTAKAPPADVYGFWYERRGWYVKLAILQGTLQIISFHPPALPLRTRSGTITAR